MRESHSHLPIRRLTWAAVVVLLTGVASALNGDPSAAALLRSSRKIDHSRMHYDRPGDGALWARGAAYKTRFDPDGPTFFPLFGPRAPRHSPVTFRLESVAGATGAVAFEEKVDPVLESDRVTYARGEVVEVYEMSPGAMEQKFVLESLPDRGDLLVRISISSELAPREAVEGLELSGEAGTVHYGRATAIDASGASAPCGTSLAEGAIEIRVPGSFLAAAELPVTIDPVISTFTIYDAGASAADVAYDESTDRYLVVFNEFTGADDWDIYAVQTDGTGSVTAEGYVDLTATDWRGPRAANNAEEDQFLVVAEVSPGALTDFTVRGRTIAADTHAMSSAFTISGGEDGNHMRPDVGGDPYPGTAYYCVAWSFDSPSDPSEIHVRLVGTDGTLEGAGSTVLGDGVSASVSKSNDEADWWVVWRKAVAIDDAEIWGARIRWNGNISTPAFVIQENLVDVNVIPSVSSPLDGESTALVVSHYDFGPDDDILAWLIDETGTLELTNLTYREDVAGADNLFRDQRHPSVDSDGRCFLVAYQESTGDAGAGDYDVHYASLTRVDSELDLSEGHVPLSSSAGDETLADLTSTEGSGGAARRFMVVWQDETGADWSIEGALCSCSQFTIYCLPGVDIPACPCNNPPGAYGKGCDNSSHTGGATVVPSGTASMQQDSFVLTAIGERPSALSIFLQGTAVLQGSPVFGQGRRCVGGTLKRLYARSASNGTVTAPQAGDPPIHVRSAMLGDAFTAGDTRQYMVYYRDPIVQGGCPPTSGYNATPAVQVHWLP